METRLDRSHLAYTALPASEIDALSEEFEDLSADDVQSSLPPKPPSKLWTRSQAWMLCMILVGVVANVALLLVPTHERIPFATLDLQSQYIGLDRVTNTSGNLHAVEVIVHPPFMTQVSEEEPDKVFPDDPHAHMTPVGTVSPDDRHFFVSQNISTIAQFRSQDFGFEACNLAMNIPPLETLAVSGNRTIELKGKPLELDVWVLDSPQIIDPRTLSWSSRPPRRNLLGHIGLVEGQQTTSPHFPCSMHSLHTFELTCSSRECLVDFWQDKTPPLLGLVLVEQPSRSVQ